MLRMITEADIPQLLAIETTIQKVPWSQAVFERCFQIDARGWVIEKTHTGIIGFILILIQATECHILNIGVDARQQRQGHGSRLLFHALHVATQQGAEVAYLEVRCSNQNAIALYSKMGFKKIGERKNYYSEEDAWVFAKSLLL